MSEFKDEVIKDDLTTEKKGIGAKMLSKMSMMFSSFWIAILTILVGLKIIDLSINDIVVSGVAITAVWTPTFISIVTDKIKGL